MGGDTTHRARCGLGWGDLGGLCRHSGARSVPCSQFMDSLQLDPDTVDNLDMYSHIPPVLMEKCAALSVRPDTVKNLVQSMQGEARGCPGWPGGHAAPHLGVALGTATVVASSLSV